MFSSRTSSETGNMTPRQFVKIPHPSYAVSKFPTPAKTSTVKFPTPRAQQRVKFPEYARGGGGCWSFNLTGWVMASIEIEKLMKPSIYLASCKIVYYLMGSPIPGIYHQDPRYRSVLGTIFLWLKREYNKYRPNPREMTTLNWEMIFSSICVPFIVLTRGVSIDGTEALPEASLPSKYSDTHQIVLTRLIFSIPPSE